MTLKKEERRSFVCKGCRKVITEADVRWSEPPQCRATLACRRHKACVELTPPQREAKM